MPGISTRDFGGRPARKAAFVHKLIVGILAMPPPSQNAHSYDAAVAAALRCSSEVRLTPRWREVDSNFWSSLHDAAGAGQITVDIMAP
jgi:hypothetical protein